MHYNYQRTYETILMNTHTHTYKMFDFTQRTTNNFIKNKVTNSQPQDHTKQISSNYLQLLDGKKLARKIRHLKWFRDFHIRKSYMKSHLSARGLSSSQSEWPSLHSTPRSPLEGAIVMLDLNLWGPPVYENAEY